MYGAGWDYWDDEDDFRKDLDDSPFFGDYNPEHGSLISKELREHLYGLKDEVLNIALKEVGRLKNLVHVMNAELSRGDQFYQDLADDLSDKIVQVREKEQELVSVRADLFEAQSRVEELETLETMRVAERREEAEKLDIQDTVLVDDGHGETSLFEQGFGD